ncbi:OmpA family protein, partial [Kineococcus glutinatus]|uniref:OmpA family protein n=1 Tax=Kineococcus glutinatus TaxID=1070872 RepID=UPI0031F097CE
PLVLVDATSDSPLPGLPPAAAELVRQTSGAGGTVTLLGVNGAGAAPVVVLDRASLADPSAGSARARRISSLAPACLEQQFARATPTATGSDQLRALQEVARRTPAEGTALVLSNGISTAGVLDMTRLPVLAVDAEAVAEAVPAAELPQGAGRTLTFYGLGETSPPLSQTARTWVADVVVALCERSGATCRRDDAVGRLADAAGLAAAPEDGRVPWPEPATVQLPDGATRTDVPAELLFAFGSAELSPDAAAVLAAVAADLRGARSLEVVGHTDSACPVDPQVCADLSLRRAQAVAGLLRAQAWEGPVPAVEVRGVGPAEPLVADRGADGELIPAAAARNRRVSVTAR